jgi:UDP-N-acetylmuramyl-tripeptide synthetase
MSEIFVTSNSREVIDGAIFIAISGFKIDGHNYIKEALQNGASYIVAEKYPEELNFKEYQLITTYEDDAPTIASFQSISIDGKKVIWDVVSNSRLAYSMWAKEAFPSQPAHLVAITGTNGKTSTAWFYQQILSLLGHKSAMIGTIGVINNAGYSHTESGLTTPDAIYLHKTLDAITSIGVGYCSMEASSIALEQHRMSGVELEAAAFTNFTQDHLDYHKSMEAYFIAKTILFSDVLKAGKTAVLNESIPEFQKLKSISLKKSHKIITYGLLESDVFITEDMDKRVKIKIYDAEYRVDYKIKGEFQKENLMASISLLLASGISREDIISVIPKLSAPIGRIELVGTYNGADIFVDYAHTPDALKRALKAVGQGMEGDVYLVFGCGGDRDKQKRPIMAAIAAEYADYIVVTDDNPRFEDPSAIRCELMLSCDAISIGNRSDAIKYAISKLKEGDVLLIAGKGHENYQIIGDVKHHFSDQEEVLKYIGGNHE